MWILLRESFFSFDFFHVFYCFWNRRPQWRHTGFNADTKVRTITKRETERVGKYLIRPLLSLKRLSLDEQEGKVCYQYDKNQPKEESMDYLEFIARVTSHIPDKGQVELWRREYNRYRPHSSLEYKPPAPEAYEVENLTQQVAL